MIVILILLILLAIYIGEVAIDGFLNLFYFEDEDPIDDYKK